MMVSALTSCNDSFCHMEPVTSTSKTNHVLTPIQGSDYEAVAFLTLYSLAILSRCSGVIIKMLKIPAEMLLIALTLFSKGFSLVVTIASCPVDALLGAMRIITFSLDSAFVSVCGDQSSIEMASHPEPSKESPQKVCILRGNSKVRKRKRNQRSCHRNVLSKTALFYPSAADSDRDTADDDLPTEVYSAFAQAFADSLHLIAAFSFHFLVNLLSIWFWFLPPPDQLGMALKAKYNCSPGMASKFLIMILLCIFNPCSCSVIDVTSGYPMQSSPMTFNKGLPSCLASSYCEPAHCEPAFAAKKRSKGELAEESFYVGIIKTPCKCSGTPCLQAYVKDGNYKPMIELVKHCRAALNSASSKAERNAFIRQLHHSAVQTTDQNLQTSIGTPPKTISYAWKIGPPSQQLQVKLSSRNTILISHVILFLGLPSRCLQRLWIQSLSA